METSEHVDYFDGVFDVVFGLSGFLSNAAGEHFYVVADDGFVF